MSSDPSSAAVPIPPILPNGMKEDSSNGDNQHTTAPIPIPPPIVPIPPPAPATMEIDIPPPLPPGGIDAQGFAKPIDGGEGLPMPMPIHPPPMGSPEGGGGGGGAPGSMYGHHYGHPPPQHVPPHPSQGPVPPGFYAAANTSIAQATADPAIYYPGDGAQALIPQGDRKLLGPDSPTGDGGVQMRNGLYTCKECNKQFTLKGNLKRHLLTHAGVKPYTCDTCQKGFSRKADLEIHQRVHTGEKPYTCPHVQCGKRFARISDLRSHERTHSGIKAFKCAHPGCDRHFARRYDMKKHMKVHAKGGGGPSSVGPQRKTTRKRQSTYDPDSSSRPAYSSMYAFGDMSSEDEDDISDDEEAYIEKARSGGRGGGRRKKGDAGDDHPAYASSTIDAAHRIQAMRVDPSINGGGGGAPGGGGRRPVQIEAGAPLNRPLPLAHKATSAEKAPAYTRVLHNSHVDMLSPTRVLECREAAQQQQGKSLPADAAEGGEKGDAAASGGSSSSNGGGGATAAAAATGGAVVTVRKGGRLTDKEVTEAQRKCGGQHATPACSCVQIIHHGLIHYVCYGKLMRRDENGEINEYGDFRVLDDDFLAFYEGIESLVQEQPVVRA